jgi:hypothetical protein
MGQGTNPQRCLSPPSEPRPVPIYVSPTRKSFLVGWALFTAESMPRLLPNIALFRRRFHRTHDPKAFVDAWTLEALEQAPSMLNRRFWQWHAACSDMLTRIFSVSLWYNFAYFVVSLALLGIGVSGVLSGLNFFQRRSLPALAVHHALSIPLSYLALNAIPLEPYSRQIEPAKWIWAPMIVVRSAWPLPPLIGLPHVLLLW